MTENRKSVQPSEPRPLAESREPGEAAPPPSDDYAELRALLVRTVRSLCPRWLASRAEDLVQVALVRILEIRGRSEQGRELSPFYLKRVAYSALIDEIRRWERRREAPLENEEGEPLPLAAATPSPERRQASRELGAGIRDCLERLHRPRRLAVTLYLQEVSVVEAAGILGWELKQARNLTYRGIGDLRRCLEAKGLHA